MTGGLLLIFFVVLQRIWAEEDPSFISLDRVKQLRDDGSVFLLAFATKSYPHCIKLGDQIPEITKSLKQKGIDADFFKMDLHVDENKEFSQSFDIRGVPTIYLFIGNDEPIKYEGSRDSQDIAFFVDRMKNLVITSLDSEDDFQALRESAPALVLVAEGDSLDEHMKIARALIDLKVVSISASLAETLGLSKFTVVRSDGVTSLSSESAILKTPAEVNSWIKMASLPPVVHFPSRSGDIFNVGVDSILFFVHAGSEVPLWLNVIGEKFRGSLVFAYVNRDDESASHVLDFFGIKAGSAVRIFNTAIRKQFWFDEAATEDTLNTWLDAYIKGEVAAHLKSEDVPDNWEAENVKVLVGTNLATVALDAQKVVFVKYYAPWCGHCKKLAPEWEALASNVADLKDVVIGKLDATANDVEDGFDEISGFPTLRIYLKNNTMLEYSGERSLDALEKYVRETVADASTDSETTEHAEL